MRILHLIAALLVVFAGPAYAKSGTVAWILTQKSGDVRVLKKGLQPASVNLRAALAPGDVIATGSTGRAMLTRGADYVVVAPSSRLLLPAEQQKKGFTRLVQQVGTMFYKVRHTGVPHFAVDTPMLAAVVKGTTFTVVVDHDRAAVQVTEGLVEVSSLTGDAKRLVEGGLTVYIGRQRPNEIIEVKPGAVGEPVPVGGRGAAVQIGGSADVPLGTVTNLTGGLVRVAPAAPVVAAPNPLLPGTVSVVPASSPAAPVVAPPAPGGSVQVPPSAPAAPSAPVVGIVDPAPVQEPVAPSASGAGGPPVETPAPPGDVAAPVVEPAAPVVEPAAPVIEPAAPVVEPVVDVVAPVVEPVVDVVTPVVEPVVDVVAPVVEPVVDVVAPVVEPVVDVVAPVVEPVVDVVAPVVEPVVDVVAPVVEPVVDVVAPVVEPVVDVVAPVVEPVVDVVAPVVEPIVDVVAPVVEPVVDVVAPVVEPVVDVVAPVVEPVVEVVAPVVEQIGGEGGRVGVW
ncbi:FecR family protein [Sphingomonas sp.]|uniref:FecR family protein n=1 Tax=Sphingomonas sp. TaxID=28214 RepID=UPI00286D6C27|nr:FecR family protein [Sphingomonas sp.]